MAIFLNGNVSLVINSVDLSVYVKSIMVNQSVDEVEVTAMGATSHVFGAGLQNGSFDIVLLNDLATSMVNQTLQAAFGTTVTIVVKQINGTTVGATNPKYSSTILVNNLAPINGAPGDYSEQTLKFTANSAIVYAIV